MDTKHTPGDWRTVPTTAKGAHSDTKRLDIVTDAGEFAPAYVAGDISPEVAAHIIHCVDNHDALVAALDRLLQAMVDYEMEQEVSPPYRHREMMDRARAAIAAAKGE